MAHLGQDEIAAAALEEFFAERFFEDFQLRADRRLRDMQFIRGFPDAAFFCHHPEVTQVMKIKKFHAANLHSQKLSV